MFFLIRSLSYFSVAKKKLESETWWKNIRTLNLNGWIKIKEMQSSHLIIGNNKAQETGFVESPQVANRIKHKSQLSTSGSCLQSLHSGCRDQEDWASKPSRQIVRETLSWKIPNTKKGCRMGQVVEHLPCKCKARNSNPSTTKNKTHKKPQVSWPLALYSSPILVCLSCLLSLPK
jgi:hypothetical protein